MAKIARNANIFFIYKVFISYYKVFISYGGMIFVCDGLHEN